MSTESTRNFTDLATRRGTIAVRAAARVSVDIRYVRAEEAPARALARSTATEAHPYSSFEQGGVRRFERVPFARGPFDGSADLPTFRVS